jgi:putative acetyltransferase
MIGIHALESEMSQTTIRRLNPNDDVTLARCLAEKYQALGTENYADKASSLSDQYSAERSAYFVMERASRIVGGVGIAPLANDVSHIADLQRFVFEPMSATIGHGIRLLKTCLQAADLMGYRACYAESFPDDIDYKEILQLTGFRVFGTPLLEARTPGCDAIHYFKLGLG